MGSLLVWIRAYRYGWFPIAGYGTGARDRVWHLVLPALALAAGGAAYYARVVRGDLAAALATDHVRTARAKGVPEWRVVLRHGLRGSLGSLVMLAGIDLGVLLGGAVVAESIFGWPGLGRELLNASLELDIPVILGVTLVGAIAIGVANLAADLLVLWLDPRAREPRSRVDRRRRRRLSRRRVATACLGFDGGRTAPGHRRRAASGAPPLYPTGAF